MSDKTGNIGHPIVREWLAEVPEIAEGNLSALGRFWRQRGRIAEIAPVDFARDKTVLQLMCGDFTGPRVVGAGRFARDLLNWSHLGEVRGMLFSHEQGRDLDSLRSTLHRLISRSVCEQRMVRDTVVDPLLDVLAPLRATIAVAESRAHVMSAWNNFVKRWDEEGLSTAMERVASDGPAIGRGRLGELAEIYEGMRDHYADIHGRPADAPELRRLRRLRQFHDDHVDEMNGCIGRLRDIVGDSPVYPTVDVVGTAAQRIEAEATAWYRSYIQLMRLFYRQELGIAMRRFDRGVLQPMRDNLDKGLFGYVVDDLRSERDLIDRKSFMDVMSREWVDELEHLRLKHGSYEQIVGSISRLSHAMRAWVQKPLTILERMWQGIDGAADMMGEIGRVPADDVESRTELFECLDEEFDEMATYLRRRAARWTELRRGFEDRLGDGPVSHEIRSIFLSSILAVEDASPTPPWVDRDALLDISINLCLNAINHLPKGDEYGAAIFFGHEGFVCIDNGPGIRLDRFAEIQRNAPMTSLKGTGLGFFIIGRVLCGELTSNTPETMPPASVRIYTGPGIGTAVAGSYTGNFNFVKKYIGSKWSTAFKAMNHSFTLS